ncbi:hypothetical protein [Endozoicomonas sp. Mp262]
MKFKQDQKRVKKQDHTNKLRLSLAPTSQAQPIYKGLPAHDL